MQKHWSQIGLMISIGITVILVLGFVGESMGLFEGGGGVNDQEVVLLCTNPECGESYTISRDEYKEMRTITAPDGTKIPMMDLNPQFTCKFCGQESASIAEKCGKCGHVFFLDNSGASKYPDICPECGFSNVEEMRKKREK